MRFIHPVLLSICLLAGLACGPKRLETRISGRQTESLSAEAEKLNGFWQVTLRLPAGKWKVKAEGEDQPIRVIEGDPFSLARWDVTPERFNASDRPLTLLLESEAFTMPIQVSYRRTPPGWVNWVLLSVAHVKA